MRKTTRTRRRRSGRGCAALTRRRLLQVPADLRLAKLKTATLRVEQASLTGESVAVPKYTEPIKDVDAELQAQECMIFAGTTISNGQAVGIVASTGMATQIGCVPRAAAPALLGARSRCVRSQCHPGQHLGCQGGGGGHAAEEEAG